MFWSYMKQKRPLTRVPVSPLIRDKGVTEDKQMCELLNPHLCCSVFIRENLAIRDSIVEHSWTEINNHRSIG